MIRATLVSVMLTVAAISVPAGAADPVSRAKHAIDPNCTPGKAAKGAAMKATVGVGNRCDVAETARDVSGVDGKADDARNAVGDVKRPKLKN